MAEKLQMISLGEDTFHGIKAGLHDTQPSSVKHYSSGYNVSSLRPTSLPAPNTTWQTNSFQILLNYCLCPRFPVPSGRESCSK